MVFIRFLKESLIAKKKKKKKPDHWSWTSKKDDAFGPV